MKLYGLMKQKFGRKLYNRHYSHFWSEENPQVGRERYFQDSCFNVFCAIKYDKISALKFNDGN